MTVESPTSVFIQNTPQNVGIQSQAATETQQQLYELASEYSKMYHQKETLLKRREEDMVEVLVKDMIHQNRVIIYPYRKQSISGKNLAENFHKKPVNYIMSGDFKLDSNKYVLVNWGSMSIPYTYREPNVVIINDVPSIKIASNKLKFFETVKSQVRIPEYTEDVSVALGWLENGFEVLGRNSSGYGGKDIVFGTEDISSFVTKDFWSKYKKKKDEYRIHVFNGKVIDKQKKSLRKTDEYGIAIDPSEIDFRVRNLANGFVFVKNDVSPPDDVINQALLAVKMCGLTFGAVDTIWNEYEGKAYVLEVNTAPGLEGSTIFSYVNAINEYKKEVL